MSTRIGIRELRQNLSKTIEQVRRGETVEVTKAGEPVARIVPMKYETKLEQLIAEGKATRGRQRLHEYLEKHPPRPSTTGISASEALHWLRGER
jgi:prevent-host-death family protein